MVTHRDLQEPLFTYARNVTANANHKPATLLLCDLRTTNQIDIMAKESAISTPRTTRRTVQVVDPESDYEDTVPGPSGARDETPVEPMPEVEEDTTYVRKDKR